MLSGPWDFDAFSLSMAFDILTVFISKFDRVSQKFFSSKFGKTSDPSSAKTLAK